jgi:hypothetical protein
MGLSVKSPFLGPTWTIFALDHISKRVLTADELDVNINEYSVIFITPSINAP